MSRIAKYPVPLPKGVEIDIAGGNISVKGPLGTIARAADPNVAVEKKGEQIEFKALGITPGFIQGFERIGYRNLPSDTLVELKALDVTPDFVMQVRGSMKSNASLDQIVQLKAIGFDKIRR